MDGRQMISRGHCTSMNHTLLLLSSFIFVSRLLTIAMTPLWSGHGTGEEARRQTNVCQSARLLDSSLAPKERAKKLFLIHLLMPSSRREVGPDRPSLSPKREPIRGVRATLGISAARESMADPCPSFLPLTWASKRRGGGSPADERGAQCSGRPSDSSSPAEGRKGR